MIFLLRPTIMNIRIIRIGRDDADSEVMDFIRNLVSIMSGDETVRTNEKTKKKEEDEDEDITKKLGLDKDRPYYAA